MLTVFYRMCGIPSSGEPPILGEFKFRLNELCLKSFVRAFSDVKPKMVFINDYCLSSYDSMIQKLVPFETEIHNTSIGINETCLMQYELAREVEGNLLFQECDYFYRDKTGTLLLEAIEKLGIASPYDHPNHYKDHDMHPGPYHLKLIGDQHWRTTESTTMTFGITSEIFRKNLYLLAKHGYVDDKMWEDMPNDLWSPIPSLATHMLKEWLSPSIDWNKEFKELL